MAKNILQDIVPPEKRSIRNIPVPKRNHRIPRAEENQNEFREESRIENPSIQSHSNGNRPWGFFAKKKWTVLGIATALLILILVIIAPLFTSATVKVFLKSSIVKADNLSLTAKKQADGGLSFDVIKITKEDGEEVVASGEEKEEKKASGQIIIFNNHDSNTQRLVKNTRFETPEGLIYRINEAVTIPGRTTKNGTTVPGSIEVTVFADEPGDKYNIGLKDFTIPGFENDPARFKSIFARSKTSMTGGFVGIVKSVSESDKKETQDSIRARLKENLFRDIDAQIPNNFVLLDGTSFVKYKTLPQSEVKGNSVRMNEEGVLYGILLNKNTLSKAIADNLDSGFSQDNVEIDNYESFEMVIQNNDSFNPEIDQNLTFTVNGDITLFLEVDQGQLSNNLAGKSKNSLRAVLANFPSIEKADAVIKPFWRKSFPKKEKKIKIDKILSVSDTNSG
ncbi:MAG: hypothetical protein CO184_01740 [Candidatus Zambryskibacteria bacterium CG_4_9_14_3_um_filter_40_16]|uniref:Baseplate protein J-like domain-containing protein n=2 Tax=Candidatus Zambryskiibacteriota TaxID=1817925 RepID=A0A2H0K6P5_9BACT|nr:MAG: hypothetical protein COV95_01690 [Candidatus Zambryskibacteria bacterium CG11_big_fil_rev_8_21_14_0_20_40_24]PJA33516.1 MAG: hypothetical protein CO184_01740 [Candidatus Zambryskibacteria bacterium CG_4_9_14_3_um_filter_40_16]